jgi:hypothetical protein
MPGHQGLAARRPGASRSPVSADRRYWYPQGGTSVVPPWSSNWSIVLIGNEGAGALALLALPGIAD